MNHKLYKKSKGNKVNMFLVGKATCSHCKKEIIAGPAYLCAAWNNHLPQINVYCLQHVIKRPKGRIEDNFPVAVVPFKPARAVKVFLTPHQLTNASDCSVFNVSKLKCDKTKDNTIHAGRDSLEGATIGGTLPPPNTSHISLSDADKKLLSFKNETNIPFIESNNVKLIGCGR